MTRNKKNQQIELSNDITDRILAEMEAERPPLLFPLPPTVDDLEEYSDSLDSWGNQITIEWAINEMQGHQWNWVRVGLVADRVLRYRLYSEKFSDWKDYCKQILGKKAWQVRKVINNANGIITLLREGFSVLPTCASQIEKLLDCCKKSGQLLRDAWEIVTDELPEPHLITANNIGEILGFPTEYEPKLSADHRRRIKEIADRDGVSVSEKLEEWIYMDTEPDELPDEPDDLDELIEHNQQSWEQDMHSLVIEHDRELWLWSVITKLINQGKRKISQFSYLRNIRCQT